MTHNLSRSMNVLDDSISVRLARRKDAIGEHNRMHNTVNKHEE